MSTESPESPFAVEPGSRSAWLWVRRGLKLKLVAVELLALLGLAVGATAVAAPQWLALPAAQYVAVALFSSALACDVVGRSLCLNVPLAPRTRYVAAASIGCQAAAIVVLIVPLFAVPELPVAMRLVTGLLLAGVAQSIAAVLFMIFARSMAIALGRTDLAQSPFEVLFLYGGSFTTLVGPLSILGVVLLCPCAWWGVYVAAVFLVRTWQEAGLPAGMLGPFLRLVPTLLVGLILSAPLYRYGRFLGRLIDAVDRSRVESP